MKLVPAVVSRHNVHQKNVLGFLVKATQAHSQSWEHPPKTNKNSRFECFGADQTRGHVPDKQEGNQPCNYLAKRIDGLTSTLTPCNHQGAKKCVLFQWNLPQAFSIPIYKVLNNFLQELQL